MVTAAVVTVGVVAAAAPHLRAEKANQSGAVVATDAKVAASVEVGVARAEFRRIAEALQADVLRTNRRWRRRLQLEVTAASAASAAASVSGSTTHM